VLRIQIRIGSEFNWIHGSASGSRKTQKDRPKKGKRRHFSFDELDDFSGELKAAPRSLKVLQTVQNEVDGIF
jgi:hypothetical protein